MKIINIDLQDIPKIRLLLNKDKLPVSDLEQANWFLLLGIKNEDELDAVGGLELCGNSLLLRSVVVDPQIRGKGLGRLLVERLLSQAEMSGFGAVHLLTLDAEEYFSAGFGFKLLDRSLVPKDIENSTQFGGTCPKIASLMVKSF
jgi:amino-acid N-acetyltransferase